MFYVFICCWFPYFLCILGVIFFVIFTYKQRKKTFELVITNKEDFLIKINPYLLQIGYHLESDRVNFITYKRYSTRIGITIDKNKAIITGPAYIVERIIGRYNKIV